jgi:hypothetical protein
MGFVLSVVPATLGFRSIIRAWLLTHWHARSLIILARVLRRTHA